MKTLKIEERVANGIALLDEKRPNWREEVDFDKLEMGSCIRCILGQLYNHYQTGVGELLPNRSETTAANHGYDIYPVIVDDPMDDWDELAKEWVRQA